MLKNAYNCVMKQAKIITKRIQYASAGELGQILEAVNRQAFQENDWNVYSVKAAYSDVISRIVFAWSQCNQYLEYGNERMEEYDCMTGVQSVLDVRQALTNLKIAKEFFENPPLVENPNKEGQSIDISKIDWSKPVFTATEVKTLLGISDSTLSRWLTGGWLSYTQVHGSDKRFIQAEHLRAFLNNDKIFYPSTK